MQSTLRTSSLKPSEFKQEELNTSDINKLKQELLESRSRLQEMETNYKTLQDASEQALNEFIKVKEEYTKESNIQQVVDLVIASLLKKNGGILSRKEIERVAQLRIGLERACKDLIHYRDKIGAGLDENASKQEINAYYTNYQKGLQTQVKSLLNERDLLQHETKTLRKTRDEVLRDMVLLNTKNTELNNELSKKAMEKEESIILNLPQRHTPPPLSPSISTDSSTLSLVSRTRKPSDASSIMCNVSSRNSFIKDQTPKIFSIKKKTSTMFNKLAGTSSSSSSNKTVKPEPSSSSSSIYGSSTSKSSIYSNNNFNSSLQSLHQESRSIAKNKGFMDSTASLQLTPSSQPGGTSSHSFQPMSFLRPVKCGACGDKIWARSEYRCDCCGFSSHSRCLSKVPQNCLSASTSNLDLTSEYFHSTTSLSNYGSSHEKTPTPAKKSVSESSMFGSDLTERVQMENQTVPVIVDACIKAVEARGLDYEGIYRKSGGAAQMRAIQLAFDQGEKIDLCDEEEYNDFCAITSVLKQYFRELPNPLLTFEHYDAFIKISCKLKYMVLF